MHLAGRRSSKRRIAYPDPSSFRFVSWACCTPPFTFWGTKGVRIDMRSLALRTVAVPLLAILALVTLLFGSAALRTDAADHLDAPTVKTDGRIDINDVYVFEGQDPAHTVLAITLNPAAGILSPTTFRQGATYQLLIDTSGDAIEDARLVVKFDGVKGDGSQRYSVAWKAGGDRTTLLKKGTTGSAQALAGGGWAQAGLFDDPFFFDLAAFNEFKTTLLNTGTLGALSSFCDANTVNFFAGFNASSIVIEVPDALLGGGTVGVWAETAIDEGGKTQVERMGLPTVNTVINHTDATKEAYNRAEPRNDVANYTDDVAGLVSLITGLAGTAPDPDAYGAEIAALVLPDVIPYDASIPADFGMGNGRALADDVVDVALSVVANTALSDCVGNDSAFSGAFPYLAPAN